MKNYKHYHKLFGVLLILAGIILYPTPIPGTTTLILLGFVWFMGKKKTIQSFKNVLSHKMFNFFKINKIVSKL